MMTRRTLLAALVGVGIVASAGIAHAQAEKPAKKGNAAAGKVAKVDAAAKTFVVTNKKKGDITVAWTDKTVFKKGPATAGAQPTDGAVTDLKVGDRVAVRGTVGEGNKVAANQVVIGGVRKKKPQQ